MYSAYIQPNHESANRKHHFKKAIEEICVYIVAYCCIQVVAAQPRIFSPLSVATNSSGKMRLMLSLHYLNRFLWKQACKYKEMRIVAMLFTLNDYMFTFDLKVGRFPETLAVKLVQSLTWLGLQIDLVRVQLLIPEAKLQAFKHQLRQLLESTTLRVWGLAYIIGKIISMSIALGPITWFMTCSLYSSFNSR